MVHTRSSATPKINPSRSPLYISWQHPQPRVRLEGVDAHAAAQGGDVDDRGDEGDLVYMP